MKNIYYDENEINKENEIETNRKLKIYTFNEFEDNIHNSELISLIDINTYNFYDITILSIHNFTSLEELNLKNNNISDIRALTFARFPNLKILNLENNKIGDDEIESVNNLNFPNLVHLSFNSNYFEDFYIFKAIEHFCGLKYLNMCSNRFNEDISNYKNIDFKFPSLEVLLLENGVFNNNSIEILSQFDLKHLEILKLDNNNLDSLSFVEKLNSDNLKELTVPNCDYEDKIYLIKFIHLEKINIDYFKEDEIPSELEDSIDNISEISTITNESNESEEFSFISITREI